MRQFLVDYLGASPGAAAVAVKLWRHTLMHTGNPYELVGKASGKRYRWLLQWGGEHMDRAEHLQLRGAGAGEETLGLGLLYLVEDLRSGAERDFADVAESDALLRQAARVRRRSPVGRTYTMWFARAGRKVGRWRRSKSGPPKCRPS
jgi:hypothetical protein